MTRALAIALALALAGAGGIALLGHRVTSPADRPRVALLTSLPLLFGEQFTLDAPRPAAIERIERAYDIVPIATADAVSLKGHRLLLMAHPRAQPAEMLVELDRWVRAGGTAVVLADPALKWESSRMLGDPLRPPLDFADTGLLAHWGVRLGVDAAGEGQLRATDARCALSEKALIATCRIGSGQARVIADADFIMDEGNNAGLRIDLMMAALSRADSR